MADVDNNLKNPCSFCGARSGDPCVATNPISGERYGTRPHQARVWSAAASLTSRRMGSALDTLLALSEQPDVSGQDQAAITRVRSLLWDRVEAKETGR